jgi:AcrR family transcriptional regulator
MAQGEDGQDGEAGLEPRAEETRTRILEAAAMTFADKGYARATTRAIASAAGVNEVTLFRHFGNKRNLFAAVMQAFGGPAVITDLETKFTGEYRADLEVIGMALLKTLLEREDALRLMLCEAAHFPAVQEVMVQNPRQLFQMLAQYFEQQVERGRVRSLSSQAMVQVYAGTLFSYAVMRWIFEEAFEPELPPQELIATLVELFVDGTVERGARDV